MIDWAPADTPAALKAAYQAERDRQRRTQLHGLWLLRQGWTLAAVAEAVGANYRTVQRWAGWYRAGGLAAFWAHKMGGTGQVPWLAAEQREAVAAEVASGRFRTAAEVGEWIDQQFGVRYSPGGLYGLLGRLRCRPKVPRPLHRDADVAAQAAWKRGASSGRSPARV